MWYDARTLTLLLDFANLSGTVKVTALSQTGQASAGNMHSYDVHVAHMCGSTPVDRNLRKFRIEMFFLCMFHVVAQFLGCMELLPSPKEVLKYWDVFLQTLGRAAVLVAESHPSNPPHQYNQQSTWALHYNGYIERSASFPLLVCKIQKTPRKNLRWIVAMTGKL